MPDRWSLQWPPGGDMGMRRSEEGQWVLWDDAVAMVAAERERIRVSIEALPRYAPLDNGVMERLPNASGYVGYKHVLAAVDAVGEEKP